MSIKRTVRQEDYLTDEETLRAYSYDQSGYSIKPRAVVRPQNEDEMRRVIVAANQEQLHLIPRGGGTGTRAGCIGDGIIVSLQHFNKIHKLDKQRNVVTVGAGVTIAQLNHVLARFNLRFPLDPGTPQSTLGGLAARNHVTEESLAYGDYNECVERAECFDGKGRFTVLKDKEIKKVIGYEGATGIITKLDVKVIPIQQQTIELVEVEDAAEAAVEAKQFAQGTGVVGIEYLDEKCSIALDIGNSRHLMIIFSNDSGNYADPVKVAQLLARRKQLPILLGEGYIEEATVDMDQLHSFADLCAKQGLPCFGHLGIGVLKTLVKDRKTFWNNVVAIGATNGGSEGYGKLLAGYVPPEERKRFNRIKEERDYENVLNPGIWEDKKTLQPDVPTTVLQSAYNRENSAYLYSKDIRCSTRHCTYLESKGIMSAWLYRVPLSQVDHTKLIESREALVRKGITTVENEKMMKRIRAGKPYVSDRT